MDVFIPQFIAIYRFSLITLLLCIISIDAYSYVQDTSEKKDSIVSRFLLFNGSASASYSDQHNWDTDTRSSVSLSGNFQYRHRLKKFTGWGHDHCILSELSYHNLSDSTWIKGNDFLKINLNWKWDAGKKWLQSCRVYFTTQWMNSYSQNFENTGSKRWQSGFGNPLTLEAGYGISGYFWKNSDLSVQFATARINARPRLNYDKRNENEIDNSLLVLPHSYIRSEYGFSAWLNIREVYWNESIIWENTSGLFFNALNRTSLNLDISNRFAYRFLKFMQVRFDTRILYDPAISYRMQYRQEILLGVFYEFRNKNLPR